MCRPTCSTTQALRAGADLETLRRIGGWRDDKMLAVYAHLMTDDLKDRRQGMLDVMRSIIPVLRR